MATPLNCVGGYADHAFSAVTQGNLCVAVVDFVIFQIFIGKLRLTKKRGGASAFADAYRTSHFEQLLPYFGV
jgi:hypothetical protein